MSELDFEKAAFFPFGAILKDNSWVKVEAYVVHRCRKFPSSSAVKKKRMAVMLLQLRSSITPSFAFDKKAIIKIMEKSTSPCKLGVTSLQLASLGSLKKDGRKCAFYGRKGSRIRGRGVSPFEKGK